MAMTQYIGIVTCHLHVICPWPIVIYHDYMTHCDLSLESIVTSNSMVSFHKLLVDEVTIVHEMHRQRSVVVNVKVR